MPQERLVEHRRAPVEFDAATVRLLSAYARTSAILARQAAGRVIEAVGSDTPPAIDAVAALFHVTLPLDECRRALRAYPGLRPLGTVTAAGLAAVTTAHFAQDVLGDAASIVGAFGAAGLALALGAVWQAPGFPVDPTSVPAPEQLRRADIELRGARHALRLALESIPRAPYPPPRTPRQRRHTHAAAFLTIADPILGRAEHHLGALTGR